MIKLTKTTLIFLILITQFSFSVQAETLKLNFGIYGSERRNWLDADNVPILRHLREQLKKKHQLDVKINTVFFPSYTNAVNALVNKDVDFARLGAASYIETKRRSPNASIIALESFKGAPYHEGVFAVSKNSPINSIADLKGKSIAFGNKSSTIGRYVSQKFLLDSGITEVDLKGYEYMGRHDNVAVAIIRRIHDAGAFKSSILKDESFRSRVKVIATFKAPTQAWVAREGMKSSLLESLKEVLISVPEEAITIKDRDAFIEGDDSNFSYLRDSIENNNLFFTKK